MKWIRPTVQQQMKKMSKYILKVVKAIAIIRPLDLAKSHGLMAIALSMKYNCNLMKWL